MDTIVIALIIATIVAVALAACRCMLGGRLPTSDRLSQHSTADDLRNPIAEATARTSSSRSRGVWPKWNRGTLIIAEATARTTDEEEVFANIWLAEEANLQLAKQRSLAEVEQRNLIVEAVVETLEDPKSDIDEFCDVVQRPSDSYEEKKFSNARISIDARFVDAWHLPIIDSLSQNSTVDDLRNEIAASTKEDRHSLHIFLDNADEEMRPFSSKLGLHGVEAGSKVIVARSATDELDTLMDSLDYSLSSFGQQYLNELQQLKGRLSWQFTKKLLHEACRDEANAIALLDARTRSKRELRVDILSNCPQVMTEELLDLRQQNVHKFKSHVEAYKCQLRVDADQEKKAIQARREAMQARNAQLSQTQTGTLFRFKQQYQDQLQRAILLNNVDALKHAICLAEKENYMRAMLKEDLVKARIHLSKLSEPAVVLQ